MSDASVSSNGRTAVITFERHLTAAPADVWRALTDPAALARWFPCTVSVDDWRVGALIWFRFPDGVAADIEGTVLAVEPLRRLVYTWGEETLTFELAAAPGGGSTLRLSDELTASAAARNAAGWEVCLDRLDGLGGQPDAWRSRFLHYTSVFEPRLGPQEGPPPGWTEADS